MKQQDKPHKQNLLLLVVVALAVLAILLRLLVFVRGRR
jgi:hypothetical protein